MKSIRDRVLAIATPPSQLPVGQRYEQKQKIERRIQELEQLEKFKRDTGK